MFREGIRCPVDGNHGVLRRDVDGAALRWSIVLVMAAWERERREVYKLGWFIISFVGISVYCAGK